MLKEHDKLYCIKDNDLFGVTFNKKGEIYEIIKPDYILDDGYLVSVEKNKMLDSLVYYTKNLHKNLGVNFNDYFITLKELRKDKLIKINNT